MRIQTISDYGVNMVFTHSQMYYFLSVMSTSYWHVTVTPNSFRGLMLFREADPVHSGWHDAASRIR